MSVSLTEPFAEAVRLHRSNLRQLASDGKRMIGYFCTYTPVEIIHGAGFLPVRLMGSSADAAKADTLTPSFICPFVRRSLADALRGEFDFLTGVVQGYTCDVACGLMNIWQENIPGEIYHTIPIPYNDSPDSRRFFRFALEDLVSELRKIRAKITEESLEASIALYRDIRESVLALYAMRYAGEMPLSARDFLWVILAGFVTPPETYLEMLGNLQRGLAHTARDSQAKGVPVMVSGSLIEDPSLLEVLEESGAQVVADDLCTGLRSFQPASGEGFDALEHIIDRYMHRFPCPARSRAEERFRLMHDLIRESNARGVVFLLQKFCTPHLADHPTLVDSLRREGIPSIMIEIGESGMDQSRLRTRLEAFIEMLS